MPPCHARHRAARCTKLASSSDTIDSVLAIAMVPYSCTRPTIFIEFRKGRRSRSQQDKLSPGGRIHSRRESWRERPNSPQGVRPEGARGSRRVSRREGVALPPALPPGGAGPPARTPAGNVGLLSGWLEGDAALPPALPPGEPARLAGELAGGPCLPSGLPGRSSCPARLSGSNSRRCQ